MSGFCVRSSKYRHVYGRGAKRDEGYDGIRITKLSWEATYAAVNSKFLAIMTDSAGGAAFLVLPLGKTGRIGAEQPLVAGHSLAVMDLAWCPHNDNVIASSSEDTTVMIWEIPDEGIVGGHMDTPKATLSGGHIKRVTSVVWHPTAKDVILSCGSDNRILLWDVSTEELIFDFSVPDQIFCVSFNLDGSKFVTTCKDKKLRVMDSHTGEVLACQPGHEGGKAARCVYLKDGRIFTTGFSKRSVRQYAVWKEEDLSKQCMEEIDDSNGINFIFYDPDSSMVYLAGKGDSQIRYYEIVPEEPYVHYLAMFTSNTPQRGIGFMPKRGLNVNTNEIGRFYKLHNNGYCEVIPFTVPRKSELFQDDLYPDTASDEPAITAEEFCQGKNAPPKLCSLKGGYVSTKKELKVQRKSNIPDKPAAPKPAAAHTTSNNAAEAAAAPTAAPALPPQQVVQQANGVDMKELMEEVKALKEKVSAQDKRIESLEQRLAQMEVAEQQSDEKVEWDEKEAEQMIC